MIVKFDKEEVRSRLENIIDNINKYNDKRRKKNNESASIGSDDQDRAYRLLGMLALNGISEVLLNEEDLELLRRWKTWQ